MDYPWQPGLIVSGLTTTEARHREGPYYSIYRVVLCTASACKSALLYL